MTQRLLGPTGGKRRRWFFLVVPFAVLAALVLAIAASAGSIGTASGFEDDDGNLVVNSTFDWNGFSPVTWTGTAPYQTGTKTASGWAFTGLTDATKTNTDTGFAGGTKQDKDCASVIGSSSPNKDDLKRVYVASKTVSGHIYLDLAWVRIQQNTTSPSAHVGFEFNQNKTLCGAGSDSLVPRSTANGGDMLIVYDFEGSSTDVPTLTVRRWIASGACDISSDSPPCWGQAQNLTTSGFAEAKVNTSLVGPVCDALAPGSNGCTGNTPTETLGLNEFGEAGIDLTAAGIFQSGVCTAFGQAEGVSRSSGNSGQAAMEDLVGPGKINLTNCGTVKIHKQDDLGAALAGAVFTLFTDNAPVDGSPPHGAEDTATSFTCGPTDASGNCTVTNVPFGDYWAVETTGVPNHDLAADQSFSLTQSTPDFTISLTFVDPRQPGAIKVTKTFKHAASGSGDHPQSGVDFTVNGVTKTTDANGVACFDGLDFGPYTVHETVPTGYHGEADKSVTVDNSAKCTDNPYTGETVSFHNTPLTDLSVTINSQVDGGTASTVSCTPAGPSGSTDPTSGDGTFPSTGLEPGTYTCTVVIDP
jgi:hypothetical protein